MAEHIVAIYANDASADAAMQDLEGAGIPVSDIRRYRPHSADEMTSGHARQQHSSIKAGRLLGVAHGRGGRS